MKNSKAKAAYKTVAKLSRRQQQLLDKIKSDLSLMLA